MTVDIPMKSWLAICLAMTSSGCAPQKTPGIDDGHIVFVNSRGSEITISPEFALIGGIRFSGKDCSNEKFHCIKYEHAFALITPKKCSDTEGWNWSTGSINVYVMAASPHSPGEMLLTTNHGNLIPYIYSKGNGVSEIYYRPDGQIGNLDTWKRNAYVNVETEIYRNTDGRPLFPCA